MSLSFKSSLLSAVSLVFFLTSPSYSFKEEDIERLKTTNKCLVGDLKDADLRTYNLKRACLKSAQLHNALLPDLTEADIYNANLTGAVIENENLLKQVKPLYKVPGRITKILSQGQEIDLESISYDMLSTILASTDPLNYLKAAFLYESYGEGPPQEEQAISFYLKAAQGGIAEAYNNLGWMHENGRGTQGINLEKALNYYNLCGKECLKGSFNSTRMQAMYENKVHAQIALGDKYASRKAGIERDYQEAAFWYTKAASQNHRHGQYNLGVLYKNGLGVARDLNQAAQLFEKAATQGVIAAQVNLGQMYEHGHGVEADQVKAFQYYQQAAEQGDISSQMVVAQFYEMGRGGVAQDYKKALKWYIEVTKQDNDSVAQYHAGRIYEYLPRSDENDQQAVKWYKEALKDHHPGAQFLLATHYEKGRGIARDIFQAQNLYQLSAQQGYIPAQIKLRLMKGRHRGDVFAAPSRHFTQVQITHLYEEAHQRLLGELEKNDKIQSPHSPLRYSLKEDYNKAMEVLLREKAQQDSLFLRINTAFIAADPYLKHISGRNDEIIDQQIESDQIKYLFQTMKEAYRFHPAYTQDLVEEGEKIFKRLVSTDTPTEAEKTLRRRFLALFSLWTDDNLGLAVPEGEADALKFRQGAAYAKLLQNIDRCRDGLSNFILEEEWKSTSQTERPMPLGVRLSFMITNYKRDFIQQHRNPLLGAHEEATEAIELLYQRMRLPLGLPGSFQSLLYPDLGKGDHENYRPEKVMDRFLKGGQIQFMRDGQIQTKTFPAYNSDLLIDLLRTTLQDKNNKILNPSDLHDFIVSDVGLKDFFTEAFVDLERNIYFDPNKPFPYESKALEYILVAHGYLLK